MTAPPFQTPGQFKVRVFDASRNQTRIIRRQGDTISGGHVLGHEDFNQAHPEEFDGRYLVWLGSFTDPGNVLRNGFLLTDIETGWTILLDDLVGGAVTDVRVSDGYVAMCATFPSFSKIIVYRPATGGLTTVATVGGSPSWFFSSGPNVACGDGTQVTVYYRLDQYALELLGF